MASANNILLGRRFFPSAMAKQCVDLSEELKGTGWYEYVKKENEWHPSLITEFWVGCEVREFIHRENKNEWKESVLSGKVRDISVDIHTPCLSIASGCPHGGTSYSESWEGTFVSTAEVDTVLFGTPEPSNKKAPGLSIKNRILHKLVQHIICPRIGSTDDVTKLERFCLYHLTTRTRASLPSVIRHHMIQCRVRGTKIPYGMLFTEIFRFYRITVAANDGLPPGSEITITNIKQMKIKVESVEQAPISHQLQKVESKPKKLQVKRQRVIVSDSSDEDTISLTSMVQRERRTKKRDDSNPPLKKIKPSEQTAQPSGEII